MSRDLTQAAIVTAIACTESYFQNNKIDSNNLTFLPPIGITTSKAANGWGSSEPTKGLLDVVSIKIGKTIAIKEFDDSLAPDVNGICLEQENSATIYVNQKLNTCYRRFIVAKELSHLLMNSANPGLRIVKSKQHSLDLIAFLTTNSKSENDGQESEKTAWWGAIELLIPKDYFDSDWFQSQNNDHNIALQIKCPTQIIELRKTTKIDALFQIIYDLPESSLAHMRDLLSRAH